MKFLVAIISCCVVLAAGQHQQKNKFAQLALAGFIGSFPYQASIFVGEEHRCGGALIGKYHILTAASCGLDKHELTKIKVVLGAVHPRRAEKREVFKVANHPDFYQAENELVADIAVVTLKSPITESKNIRPIALPSKGQEYSPGTQLIFTGYGLKNVLRKLPMTTLNTDRCQKSAKITAEQFCVAARLGRHVCAGDGGSPATLKAKVLLGVASANLGKGCVTGPYLLTKVESYLDFIHSELALFQ